MSTQSALSIRDCKKAALFADDDPCASCFRLDDCLAEPPLTDGELREAIYDRYLAPFFEPLVAALRRTEGEDK